MIRLTEKNLECLLCQKRYSVDDVKKSLFFASTMVCAMCYSCAVKNRGQKDWCFGGYDKRYRECRVDCPDKRICRFFTRKKSMTQENT